MEAPVRPVEDPSHISVLHRIEVDVIDVTVEVRVIADCVLPKPSLPDSRFAPSYLGRRSQLSWSQSAEKSALELAPARREIGIARRAASKRHGDGPARYRWRSSRTAGAIEPRDRPAASARYVGQAGRWTG